MLQLELIELLNKYKKSDKYEQEKIKNSISNLILENKDEFNKFIKSNEQNLDIDSKNLLQNCFDDNLKKEVEKEENDNLNKSNSDFDMIKEIYNLWLKEYLNNDNQVNSKCVDIANKIIENYADSKMDVIQKILNINDSNNFNSFKIMIKNLLRSHFAKKIIDYRKSNRYQKLNFFQKIMKKKEILNLYDELGKYEFNVDKINKLIGENN